MNQNQQNIFEMSVLDEIMYYINGVKLDNTGQNIIVEQGFNNLNQAEEILCYNTLYNIFTDLSEFEITWKQAYDRIYTLLDNWNSVERWMQGENLYTEENIKTVMLFYVDNV